MSRDTYTKGNADMSVTGLISPPRVGLLTQKHWDEIEVDAAELAHVAFGQAMHVLLERANATGIAERRMSVEIGGWKISGGMDLVTDEGKLIDHKTGTAWKFKDGEVPLEYEQQLNCYAEILRRNGETVTELEIFAFLKDWSKLEALRNDGYPRFGVLTRKVKMWPADAAYNFMLERVKIHQAARDVLPECTPEEKWQKATIYAVHKEGKKAAEKLYKNETEAKDHAMRDAKLYVQTRPAEATRCRAYCNASKFCTQYQREKTNAV